MKQSLVDVFNDTQKIFKEDNIAKLISESIGNTKIYADKQDIAFDKLSKDAKVTVTKFKTIESASYFKRKFPDKQVCILNFASATNPGGGVLKGSTAQEESICRVTTLYPVLNTQANQKAFYQMHKNRHNAAYTGTIIYTPDIAVLKNDTSFSRLKQHQLINVITCAAPNLKAANLTHDQLYDIHVERAKRILSVAAANHNDIIVLGAFGCGAFQNPPDIVADAYKFALQEFKSCFDEINFAIYCNIHDLTNFNAFKKKLM